MKKFSKPLILAVIFFLLSFAITVQVRLTNNSESEASRDKVSSELKDKIFELSNSNEKLKKQLDVTEKNLDSVRSNASNDDASNKEKSELIKKYSIIDCETDVKGAGIIIRYFPNEKNADGYTVGNSDITKDLVDIVNELKNAGAEAISVNDIRMTNMSSIEMEKNNIVIDENKIAKPYVIKSIGNSETMNSSLIRPGGTMK